MTHPILITTQTTQHGAGPTLAIRRETDHSYRVGILVEGGQFQPLEVAQFWTYESAHVRFQEEVGQRR